MKDEFFRPNSNAVDTANSCHMMSYSFVEKDPNGNKRLNLNLE